MSHLLQTVDFAALAPLLALLVGCLALLLIESISDTWARKYALLVTMVALLSAFYASWISTASVNPLLTHWLSFDAFARLFTLVFLTIGMAAALLASAFFKRFSVDSRDEIMKVGGATREGVVTPSQGEYFFLLLAALFGLILIGAAADFLTLFLGLETLSIALYVLCGYMKKWKVSHEAAMKYFLMGALAAAFLLYGIALVYGAIGTTQFGALLPEYRALSGAGRLLFLSGIALVTLGLAFKAALVPFHLWAPDVYDGAPTPVTAFMAVGTKIGAFAAFARIFLVVLPHFDPLWNQLAALLAYPTLIYANIVALRQVQLRRFFAYSGISHAGFLLLPLAAGTPDSVQALVFYLLVYGLATLGCFAVLAFLDERNEGVMIRDLHGLFRRAPLLAVTFALCILTLAGIPPTVGFFAKLYVFKVAFQAGFYGLVIVALLTTILSAFYYLRIIAVMFSEVSVETAAPRRLWPAAVVSALAFIGIVTLSFRPETLLTWIKEAL